VIRSLVSLWFVFLSGYLVAQPPMDTQPVPTLTVKSPPLPKDRLEVQLRLVEVDRKKLQERGIDFETATSSQMASQVPSESQTDQLIDSLVRIGCASIVTSPIISTVSGNQSHVEIASEDGALRFIVASTINGDEAFTEIEIERTWQLESVNGLPAPKRTKKCGFSSTLRLGKTCIAEMEVNGKDSTNFLMVRCDRTTEDVVGSPVLPTAIVDGNVEIRALREENWELRKELAQLLQGIDQRR